MQLSSYPAYPASNTSPGLQVGKKYGKHFLRSTATASAVLSSLLWLLFSSTYSFSLTLIILACKELLVSFCIVSFISIALDVSGSHYNKVSIIFMKQKIKIKIETI